jgi:pimeloyl-ACP methyl ester carboxylesterase
VELLLDRKKVFAYTAAHDLDSKKPTVVFVHGAGLDHSSFALQSRYFGYHGRNVLAVDLPGHGRSEGPPLPAVADMAGWILKVLDAVKVEKAAIVGHSMGSLIAVECAAANPERVEKLALIGTGYPMKVGDAFLDAARRNDVAAYDMETIWGHAPATPLGSNPNPGMWMYGDALARLGRLAPGVLYNDLNACNTYASGTESAAKVRCPVLFILGRRDTMTPVKTGTAFAQAFTAAKSVQVATSGHTLMAEAPDATLDALISFL